MLKFFLYIIDGITFKKLAETGKKKKIINKTTPEYDLDRVTFGYTSGLCGDI